MLVLWSLHIPIQLSLLLWCFFRQLPPRADLDPPRGILLDHSRIKTNNLTSGQGWSKHPRGGFVHPLALDFRQVEGGDCSLPGESMPLSLCLNYVCVHASMHVFASSCFKVGMRGAHFIIDYLESQRKSCIQGVYKITFSVKIYETPPPKETKKRKKKRKEREKKKNRKRDEIEVHKSIKKTSWLSIISVVFIWYSYAQKLLKY